MSIFLPIKLDAYDRFTFWFHGILHSGVSFRIPVLGTIRHSTPSEASDRARAQGYFKFLRSCDIHRPSIPPIHPMFSNIRLVRILTTHILFYVSSVFAFARMQDMSGISICLIGIQDICSTILFLPTFGFLKTMTENLESPEGISLFQQPVAPSTSI